MFGGLEGVTSIGHIFKYLHDRHFLDQVVDKIWELKDGGISEFWGDYSDYLRQKEEERKVQAARYEEAMRERERLEAAIEKQRKKARQVDAKRKAAKKSNEYAGRLGHQKATGTKQKRMYQAAKDMATGPIETHLHHSFNWENAAPGARIGPRGRSVNCGSVPSAQCVRLGSEINQ